jgi:hypothetical protein
MGYRHINNLNREQNVLMFKEVWALEKVHGTSAHISWNEENQTLGFFAGGESHERFVSLFDQEALKAKFMQLDPSALGPRKIVVYGEAYGGKQQGMSDTYGPKLMFIAFEVLLNDIWLSVPDAHRFVDRLGLEFVPYKLIPCTEEALNVERDADSEVAIRRGIGTGKMREGIVIRPPIEFTINDCGRVMAKYKRAEFSERRSKKDTCFDPEKRALLTKANEIAEEWVTFHRLEHVLQRIPQPYETKQIPDIIKEMREDVYREGKGEVVEGKEVDKAIGNMVAKLFKELILKL